MNRSSSQRRRLRARRARMEVLREADSGFDATVPAMGVRMTENVEGWVDLLHHEPLAPVATETLRAALRFAFESGDAGGMLTMAVDQAPVAPSTWDPEGFQGGLFLEELLEASFTISIEGQRYLPSAAHLGRVLAHPPDDIRDVELRQEVLRELVDKPALRTAVEKTYIALHTLRSLLDEQPMSPGETVRRKVEVLQTLRRFFDSAADGLQGATSALARLQSFAEQARGHAAYGRLQQILDFDDNMANVEVRVVLGSDGKIRDFQLLEARENTANPLVRSPWLRAWSRFRAWIRGYRYGENEVLLKVIDEVFEELEDMVLPCFRLVGDLEVYLASLAFRDRAKREGLEVSLPVLEATPAEDAPPGPLKLTQLFNPLLFLQGITPVPCDIDAAGHDSIVLVTGPNSGGKTRLLQALAYAQLFGQNGLFVPAKSAHLTRAPTMFVSLVEEAASDQKEGRLGTELLRVRHLFERLQPGSVVILDELCSGTNPSEGIAIFEMVISLLPRLRPQVFLTTHFLDAARKLADELPVPRLSFLQVELDDDAKPTFQFVAGVAPTSLAQQVAARLGVTHEELEALVKAKEDA